MDWSKAKNILIIAFIITNLLLLYVIGEDRDLKEYPTVSDAFINDVRIRLLKKNIQVNADIPKQLPSLPLLNIEYEVFNSPEDLVKQFLSEYKIEEKEDATYYTNNQETVSILGNKKIRYYRTSDDNRYKDLNHEKLNTIVENFLRDRGFTDQEYTLNDYRYEKGNHILEYTKVYENMSIESSYMRFQINQSGVTFFERQWAKEIKPNEGRISVRSAPDAILRLLLMEKHYGKTISDITLCYYLNLETQSLSSWKKIVKGNAVPAWRVRFEDGTEEFLEEY